MNHIYIIGNGFDISHGLPTKYRDFILWYLYEKYQEIRKCAIILGSKGDDGLIKYSWREVAYLNTETFEKFTNTSDFKKAIDQITYNKNLSLEIQPFLSIIMDKDGWADIEKLYYETICKASEGAYGNAYGITQINEGMASMKRDLKRYLKDVVRPMARERLPKNSIIDIFEEGNKNSSGDGLIVNFNYTGTISLYRDYIPNLKHIHLHGRAVDGEDIIFGYGNERDRRYSTIESLDNSYLENIKSILYTNTEDHGEVINYLGAGEYYVHVIGHSLGEPDWSFLSTIFQHRSCKRVELHYFRNGSYDNFLELSRNISRILPIESKVSLSSLVVSKQRARPMS